MKKGKTFAALGGLAVGAGLGMLFAPKKGSETRKELSKKINELLDAAKKIDKEEALEYIEKKIDEIKEQLDDLDKEDVLEIAKKKGKEIQGKVEELAKYAKKRGNEELTKAAEALRVKTIEVSKEVIKKLEK